MPTSAWAIEYSDTRVVEGVLDLISRDASAEARKSYRENMKHACISDGLAIESDGRVVVSGTFSDPEVLSLAHHNLDQIEEWMRGYCDIDRKSKVRRLLVRPEPMLRRLELNNARFERLGVRMSKKNVIDLISSNAVWRSNIGAPVRELIQNSVEACRYRKFHSAEADHYSPLISVIFDRLERTVTVQDNGCGMSERVVLNNFLTVGNSRANEKAYASEDYAPIARFGIGFWSVFTIANRAWIKTLAFEDADAVGSGDGTEFEVELGDLKDYTVFSHKHSIIGTAVKLALKSGVVVDEVFEQTRKELLCSDVDVVLMLDEEQFEIPSVTPSVTDEDILDAKLSRQRELGIETFQWGGTVGETDLTMGFAYRTSNGRATFLDESKTPIVLGSTGIRSRKSAVCGFRTNARSWPFCFDILRVGTYFANYKTPRGIEFSIDRQQLQENEASRKFASDTAQLVHHGYREFLKKTGSQDAEAIFSLNEQSRMNGGNVVDTFTGNELADAYSNYPDLLCFKLRAVDLGASVTTSQPEFVSLSGLAGRTGTIWVVQNHYSVPVGAGKFASFPAEALLPIAYLYAVQALSQSDRPEGAFIAEPDRSASMLFDCDPESSVEFFQAMLLPSQPAVTVCIQRINLGNVRFGSVPDGILAEVQGRWSGAIYLRDFSAPNEKPYAFLGRHRVLIKKSSRLESYLRTLNNKGQLTKLADTISLLKDDEAGFTPAAIAGLL